MKEDVTKRMWGIFNEIGIFLALCRHGFALVIADMVKSGELYVFFVPFSRNMLTLRPQERNTPSRLSSSCYGPLVNASVAVMTLGANSRVLS